MAALSVRQGMLGFSLRSAADLQAVRRFPSSAATAAPQLSQLGLSIRSYSVRAPSRPQVAGQPSIRGLYAAHAAGPSQLIRCLSLLSSSSSSPAQPRAAEASLRDTVSPPSDGAASSSAIQVPTSTLDSASSSLENLTHNIESHMADATERVQTLSEMGHLSSWPNVRAAQFVLDWMVEATGLPWWATIALVTVMVRVLVLPLVFKGQANAIRLGNIQPRMQTYMKDINYAKKSGNQVLMAESAMAVQKLMKENNCSPFKSLITPAVLMPIFITFFFALRGLAEAGLSSMHTGGIFWFPNLAAADPLTILPVISAGMTLLIVETGAEMGGTAGQTATPQAKFMKNFLRVLTVVSVFFIYHMPAAVFCFWATNNTFSLLQLLALRQPAVRKALNLPEKNVIDQDKTPKGKPMGFWESVGAGKASQTTGVRAKRDGVPSALQTRRQLEEGREAALQKLMLQQGLERESKSQVPPMEPLTASEAAAPVASESHVMEAEIIQEDRSAREKAEEVEEEREQERAAAIARVDEEKRQRVALAREKRMRKKKN